MTLMYHNLGDPLRARFYDVGVGDFRAQLAWLKSEGYTIEGFAELRKRLRDDRFPERYVVVTFDDGHKSNLTAAQILRESDAQATFFLTKELCETRPDFLDDGEIRELADLCAVGSHGLTHSPLTKLSAARVESELAGSKKWLEDLVGREIDTVSMPGGFISRSIVDEALRAGYRLVGNSVEWWNASAQVSATRVVNRIAVRQAFSMSTFQRIVRAELAFLLTRRLRSAALAVPKHLLSKPQLERLRRRAKI